MTNEHLILQKIDTIRKDQPRCGGRKLLIDLQPFFDTQGISIGRDIFFDLLRRNKLLVRNSKYRIHTTKSKHYYYRYPNLVKDFAPMKAHRSIFLKQKIIVGIRSALIAKSTYK